MATRRSMKNGTAKRTSKRTPKQRKKKRESLPSAPESMRERAVRETSLWLGRKSTHHRLKPFNGLRPDVVCDVIYAEYGIASAIAAALRIHYSTFNNWKNTHAWIREALSEARETMLDLGESSLVRSVKKDEGWATCFLLKCRGKERGYVEKLNISGTIEGEIDINLTGAGGDVDDPDSSSVN